MILLVCIAGLWLAYHLAIRGAQKDREKSLQQFAEFCENFNNKLKLLAGYAAVQALADKYDEGRLTQRIGAVKHEVKLLSLTREEALQKVIQKAETETDPDEKNLLLALFYATTARWANDLGLAEDVVRNLLDDFAEQLGFSKESEFSQQRN